MKRINDYRVPIPKWDIKSLFLPSKAQGSWRKRSWGECKSQRQWMTTKDHVPHTTGQQHIRTHSSCDNMHKTQIQDSNSSSSQTKSQWRVGRWAWSPSYAWGSIGNCQLMGEGELVKGLVPGRNNMLRWMATCLRAYRQHWWDSMDFKKWGHRVGCI